MADITITDDLVKDLLNSLRSSVRPISTTNWSCLTHESRECLPDYDNDLASNEEDNALTFQKIRTTASRKKNRKVPQGEQMPMAWQDGSDPPKEPHFGCVYFGVFRKFGHGKPHYGMCTNSRRTDSGFNPVVEMSPITSKEHQESSVVIIPAGVLPHKIMDDGKKRHVQSYLLLYLTLLEPRSRIQDKAQFQWELHMPEDISFHAKEILRCRG